jgi:hypothetical protein
MVELFGAWRSMASALALGARGPRFKSGCPDLNNLLVRRWFNGKTIAFQAIDTGSIPVRRSWAYSSTAERPAQMGYLGSNSQVITCQIRGSLHPILSAIW